MKPVILTRRGRWLAAFLHGLFFLGYGIGGPSTLGQGVPSPAGENVVVAGLHGSVEIVRDSWGIAHIYARDEHDLFFAQGFNVASDRLFQLELWRRQATGTVAEILGPEELGRDVGARLLKYRGDLGEELSFYHPRGREIISAFVEGINAYVDRVRGDPALLPLEFKLLGIKPERWTSEVVVSRHNGLFRNVGDEVALAQALQVVPPEELEKIVDLHPGKPGLRPPDGLDVGLMSGDILELYRQARSAVRFGPDDLAGSSGRAGSGIPFPPPSIWPEDGGPGGSNNWAVSGKRTETGSPFLANDPHRALQIPSLRYWVHLVAPGWNVIGGGEPALPGVSIGHNEHGAWGLTIFAADQEDLFVYDLDPDDPRRYRYQGRWEELKVVHEAIPVRGKAAHQAALKFTRHGPVLDEDLQRHKAYALRAAWLEKGCAPYLASLRMDQARNWTEFREAAFRNRTPSENMIWADREGNIGWQATGIVPLRKNWTGLLPVPGDGRYEWDGLVQPAELPSLHNPEAGFIATANQDNLPPDFPHPVGYLWSDPFRFLRITEVLGSRPKVGLEDMVSLQQDVLSIPARRLTALLKGLKPRDPSVQPSLALLQGWDGVLSPESEAATLFASWQRVLRQRLNRLFAPRGFTASLPGRSLRLDIERLEAPDRRFGAESAAAEAARDELLLEALAEAAKSLTGHYVRLRHPLSAVLNPELRAKLDLGPLSRGGSGDTVNATGNAGNQTSGATFRIIADTADWDRSLGMNMPGQSGDPKSAHYADLFKMWVEGRYFPVYFSRPKVESAAEKTIRLLPAR